MREMKDKMQMKKELLQELIKLMNEEMSGKLMPEGSKEMPEMDMSDEEPSMEMDMPEEKEPSMVEIEIEKKPLKEGLKDMKEEMPMEPEMDMSEEPEMEEDVDDEDVSYIAAKKFQKGMKKKEQE